MSNYLQLSSLRTRLMLTYIGLIIVGFGGLTWLAGRQLSSGSEEDFAKKLAGDAVLVANALVEVVEDYPEEEVHVTTLQPMLENYAQITGARITLLDLSGQPWATSSGALPSQPVLPPDKATAGKIYQAVDANGAYHTVAPIFYEGRQVGSVELSAADTVLQQAVRERQTSLSLGFVVFVVLALLLGLWLSSTLTNPLSRLRDAALSIAQGDLSKRVTNLGNDEIGAVGAAFNQMATQVEAMVEEQRTFASNASHELRTPLTTIRLRTELLKEGNLDAETVQQYIGEIDGEATRLSGLVDDLILLSRLETARLSTGDEQVDPKRLALSLTRELAPFAAARSITLTLADMPDLPPVQANVNHLQVVFRNLLENAIKYTQSKGEISWQLEQADDFLRVVVHDNGQGIATEDLPHVNQRFYRADGARSRRIQGVGLGLALVQSIMNLYGGHFKIESPGVGLGTTVTILWPLQHPA